MSVREARYRLGMTFEFADVMKTEISRDRRFVELTNSEHGPEIITHMEIAKRYETIYVDHPIRRYFTNDGEERLSDKAAGAIKWPRGNYLHALAVLNDEIEHLWRSPKQFLGAARKIARLGLHIGRPPRFQLKDLHHSQARLLWAVCIPAGFVGYVRDRLRGRTAPNVDPDMSSWGPAADPECVIFHPPPERVSNASRPFGREGRIRTSSSF